MYAPVSDIPEEILSNFWRTCEISERARQKGLQYAFEGYIHDIICTRLEKNLIKIEAKAYRSQRKQQPPHTLTIQMGNTQIEEQLCSCTAGAPGYCSHVVGLIYALDLARGQDAELSHTSTTQTKSSCTSLPQQWHKPRGSKIRAVPISSVVVAKANENRKRRPIDCRYSGSRTFSVTEDKIALLKRQTGGPISYLVNRPPVDITVGGERYPLGSGLSHQGSAPRQRYLP
ncbi:uncharacterized protein [Pseudorasbora parva]|uniref:uncharacterized protein isoform X2 n=1 Tax=Pseudorasbora parva TaxID=51549 RepID=UPI00351E3ED0